jgi:hypothetical protein
MFQGGGCFGQRNPEDRGYGEHGCGFQKKRCREQHRFFSFRAFSIDWAGRSSSFSENSAGETSSKAATASSQDPQKNVRTKS